MTDIQVPTRNNLLHISDTAYSRLKIYTFLPSTARLGTHYHLRQAAYNIESRYARLDGGPWRRPVRSNSDPPPSDKQVSVSAILSSATSQKSSNYSTHFRKLPFMSRTKLLAIYL